MENNYIPVKSLEILKEVEVHPSLKVATFFLKNKLPYRVLIFS